MTPASTSQASSVAGEAELADGIYMVILDEDVVVLDSRADAYVCIAGGAAVLGIDGARITAGEGVIALLREGGLLADGGPVMPRPALPDLPRRTLSPSQPGKGNLVGNLIRVARFWLAWTRARNLARRSLAEILRERRPSSSDRPIDEAALGALTATFVRLLPWAPGQGACLYRAYLLRTLLRSAGHDALWVFGVRTWPFSAHCWLQVGDAVLDDDPDRVGVYTPIMVA